MDIETSRKFENLVYKIQDATIKKRLYAIITKVEAANSLDEIPNIKPITGHPGYYRIKFENYRIGLSIEDEVVWFLFFGKRNEATYKKFP